MKKKSTIIILMILMVILSMACWFPPYIQDLAAPNKTGDVIEFSEEPSNGQQGGYTLEETLIFSSKGVSIRLPNSYQLGDIDAGAQALTGLGQYEQLFEKNKDNIMLWAYESSPIRSQTHLIIIKNSEYAALPLGVVSTFANVLLGDAVESMTQERLTLGERATIRFLTETQTGGTETGQAVYLFKDSGKLWVIVFLTDLANLSDQLPIFDQAIASFLVLSGE